jgi:hypothetical protein
MRRLAVVAAALVFVPSAFAWTTLGGSVLPQAIPSLIVTQSGTELASWDSPAAGGTITVARNGGAPKTVVTGDASAGRTQLVQQPNGAIQLYFPNPNGVARLTSTDDGVTWSSPVQTQSHTTGGVESAALLPDGTPLFSQDGTGFVNVFRGLNGEQSKNVYTRCCGYHESLAVDSSGLAQIAFYSNADPDGATVYEPLGADRSPASSTPLKPVAEHEAPLVADHSGNTFLAWAPGYPSATSISVVPFRAGAAAGDGVSFRGPFSGGDPHIALAVDTQDRLWAIWTSGSAVHAARSRSHGAHFGATVTVPMPATAHGIAAVARAGTPGSADVVINTGSSLIEQRLQPGLSVRVTKTTKKVGKVKIVTRWAQALDDGFAVPTATFRIAGRTYHANAAGKAKVPAGSGKAAAAGYVGASFHTL